MHCQHQASAPFCTDILYGDLYFTCSAPWHGICVHAFREALVTTVGSG